MMNTVGHTDEQPTQTRNNADQFHQQKAATQELSPGGSICTKGERQAGVTYCSLGREVVT